MTIKTTVTRGVAMGALAAVAAGTAAEAKPAKKHHHHHHHHPVRVGAPANLNAEMLEELRLLRAEVSALKGRVDAQSDAAQQADARATVAEAKATADDVRRVPVEVKAEVAALPKPKTGWWDDTALSGKIFFDLSDIDQTAETGNPHTGKVAPSGAGFDIKRSYVNFDHRFNDVFSAEVTTDMMYSSAVGATELYIKRAYLQAKVSDALIVRLGSADMPWIPFDEDVYGNRYLEMTIIDRTKYGNAADWGAHFLGSFSDGKFAYQFSIVNGAGYKTPGMPIVGTQGRSKDMDFEGRVNANLGPFVFAVGGYDGHLGKDVAVTPPAVAPAEHTATRIDALAAYVTPRTRLGVEYFEANDWAVTGVDKARGVEGFASYKLADRWSVFGRYDRVTPNRVTTPKKSDGYYNFGVAWQATKGLDLALVYKHERVDDGTFSTGNGVIGAPLSGSYDEAGLFGQVRW